MLLLKCQKKIKTEGIIMLYKLIDLKKNTMTKETSLRSKETLRAESQCIIFTNKSMKWVKTKVMKISELLLFIK